VEVPAVPTEALIINVVNPLKTEGILRKFQKVITHPKVEGFQK
jgi:hypothetical protein